MKAGTPGQHPEPSRESLSSHHLSSERGETNCPLSAPNPGMMHRDQALLPSHSQHPSTASHHSPQARSSGEDLELLSCTFCSWHFWLLFVLNPSDEKIKYWPCWFWVLAEPTDLHRAAVTGGYSSVCHVQMCSESPGKVELLNKAGGNCSLSLLSPFCGSSQGVSGCCSPCPLLQRRVPLLFTLPHKPSLLLFSILGHGSTEAPVSEMRS